MPSRISIRSDDGEPRTVRDPVDASGAMVDGTQFTGPVEFRKALLERSDAFRTTITERLLGYAVKGQLGIIPIDTA